MNYSFDEIIDREGTACVKWDLRDKVFGNPDVLPMWVADMDFETPGFITDAVIQRARHAVYGYSFREDGYYTSVINWMQSHHGWTIEQDWIVHTPGVVPLLYMATLAFTNPGDNVLIQTPVYPPFFDAVIKNDRKLVFNPLILKGTRYEIDFEDLDLKLAECKMMIISNPHNPVSRVWTKDELLEIGRLCLKHNVLLISDEIHCDLVLSAYKHIPTASLSTEIANNTLTCIAASKTFNTAGLSTSNVVVSNPVLRAILDKTIQSVHIDAGNLFGAVASEAAYTYGEEWHKQLIAYLESNVELVRSFLSEKLPAIKLIEPEATYLLWLDFRTLGLSQPELVKLLIHKAGLGLNDGTAFGTDGIGFMRINIGCPQSMLLEGLLRLEKALTK